MAAFAIMAKSVKNFFVRCVAAGTGISREDIGSPIERLKMTVADHLTAAGTLNIESRRINGPGRNL